MPLLSQTTYVKFGAFFDETSAFSTTVAQVLSWKFVPTGAYNEIVAPDLTTTTRSARQGTIDLGTLELEINIDANVKQSTAQLFATYQGQRLNYAVAVTIPDNPPADRYQQFSFEGIMRDTSRNAAVDAQLTQTIAIRLQTNVSLKYLSTLIM
jgi:hypothetical protein